MEKILIKTIGGPKDGETRICPLSVFPQGWPPPEKLDSIPGYLGYYERESYSQLPSDPKHPNLMRGAQYRWVKK